MARLKTGSTSPNGQITIIDEDRLCYLVKSVSKGAVGIRTISKTLLSEFVGYMRQHPAATANDARNALCGLTEVDKFEYGYASSLVIMAKMELGFEDVQQSSEGLTKQENQVLPLQQIFYGAPGTGKSNTIKCEVDKKNLPRVRTTFHPDSDYSTFVGAYKPTTIAVPMRDVTGKVIYEKDKPVTENRIVYEFVPQAFLKAYAGAWKNQDEPFFLIIEEINRGNCAQIFGDLFQLLDRNDETGLSDYPISPDEDIQKFLLTDKKYGFAELTEEQAAAIPEEIRSGELLKLPKNLHIWATMNTSDQSLFPIDSAFKRRWDWRYMPISDGKKGWLIEANDKRYDWWQFLLKVNEKIGSATNSEDKKLGYFFCKAKDGIIDAETFVSKVVFYLWNDVFKDFADEAGTVFQDVDGSTLSFNKFYTVDDNGTPKVVEDKIEHFLRHLGIGFMEDGAEEDDEEDVDASPTSQKDYSRYKLNGNGSYRKAEVVIEAVKKYVNDHPEESAEMIAESWKKLANVTPPIVETSSAYISRKSQTSDPNFDKRAQELRLLNGEYIYVRKGFNPQLITGFINEINKKPWGIHIEKIE